MPTNKDAVSRYFIIDRELRKAFQVGKNGCTIKHLLRSICLELYGDPGVWDSKKQAFSAGISRRTLYNDLEALRLPPFNAPIHSDIFDRGITHYFYGYNYALGDTINENSLLQLYKAQATLAQLGLLGLSEQINSLIEVATEKLGNKSISHKIPLLLEYRKFKGMERISEILEAILEKPKPNFNVTYQPFNQDITYEFWVEPLVLKEYNRRWYLIAYDLGQQQMANLGLDRIISLQKSTKVATEKTSLPTDYQNLVGVTIPENNTGVQRVVLQLKQPRAKYLATKPLHQTQKTIETNADFMVFALEVIVNKELVSHILEYGGDIKVLEPQNLITEIKQHLKTALEGYGM